MENVAGHEARQSTERPFSVLAIDKVAVLRNNRARYRMIRQLADVELTLVAPERWPENLVMEEYQRDDTDPYTTILGKVSWPGKELLSIYYTGIVKAMRRSRPDVILMMEEGFSMFALQALVLQRLFAPRAVMIFYGNHIGSYRRFPYRLFWFYRIISEIVLPRMQIGFCVNERAEQVLSESSFRGERRVRFHGINEDLFRRIPMCQARAELELPPEGSIFLFAGRLLEQKGVMDLIDAFASLRAERPGTPLHLLLVGDGDYGAVLRQRVDELGLHDAVEFRRAVPVEQVATYMSAATAFVLPSRASWKEQFGRVNAEAMLLETTIIGSTSGEIPRIIGEGGFIFRADDVDDLARTMARVLDDPDEVERRRAIGRQIAVERYSVRGFVNELIVLFERIAGRPLGRKGGA